MEDCLNCGHKITGKYCSNCGQLARDNKDRSLLRLLGTVFANLFFFDNRFWTGLKYLVLKPGVMSKEFLDGKRRKFVPPVTFFLFLNLIYFLLSPTTDYSLGLTDQINLQPYSKLGKEMVLEKIRDQKTTMVKYRAKYNRTSDNISKSVMLLNVPLIALFTYLLSFWRRKYFFDSLVFTLHFFTTFLLLTIVGHLFELLAGSLFGYDIEGILIGVFVILLPVLYAVIGIRNYLGYRWGWSIVVGILVYTGGGVAMFIYRGIIFFLTFWAT